MKTLIAALALLSFLTVVPAQRDGKAGLSVRGRGRLLVLTEKGRTHSLNLGDQISAAKLDDVKLLLAAYDGESTYLILDACGPSKLRPDARQCGAGIECDLIWLKLDAGRRVADSKAVRYESCWLPITSDGGIFVWDNRLRLDYVDLREKIKRRVEYYGGQPEKGFQIAERPLDDVP